MTSIIHYSGVGACTLYVIHEEHDKGIVAVMVTSGE